MKKVFFIFLIFQFLIIGCDNNSLGGDLLEKIQKTKILTAAELNIPDPIIPENVTASTKDMVNPSIDKITVKWDSPATGVYYTKVFWYENLRL